MSLRRTILPASLVLVILHAVTAQGGSPDFFNAGRQLCFLCDLIELEAYNREPVPTDIQSIEKWITATDSGRRQWANLDPRYHAFQDFWGHPMVVLIRDGQLAGFGSGGANGLWENGDNDDIQCFLSRFGTNGLSEVIYGPRVDTNDRLWLWILLAVLLMCAAVGVFAVVLLRKRAIHRPRQIDN